MSIAQSTTADPTTAANQTTNEMASGLSVTVDGWIDSLATMISQWGLSTAWSEIASMALVVLAMIVAAVVSAIITRVLLRLAITPVLSKAKHPWMDSMVRAGVLRPISHLVPAILLVIIALPALARIHGLHEFIGRAVNLYIVWILWRMVAAAVRGGTKIADDIDDRDRLNVHALAQAVQLILVMAAIIAAMSVMFAKTPIFFLSGIGAVMAVLILVFKDVLLGLVSGIQMSINQMVQVGDWVQATSLGADGDVVDISLMTTTIRNWDNTLVFLPNYQLVQTGFVNWRGMSESGGRRIKRSIVVDMRTIRFVDGAMMAQVQRLQILEPWLKKRQSTIASFNTDREVPADDPVNGRHFTNIGLFRAYTDAYLHSRSDIHKDMTLMVRQLSPTNIGLPLQIYAFTTTTAWEEYEGIQSDIMDHLLAMMPLFGLDVAQQDTASPMARRDRASLIDQWTGDGSGNE